jgi:DNA-binding response OmpR family regulator
MTMVKKILFLEEDQAIRMLYADEFSREGYDVITCGEGLRVMEMIRGKCPDLIVMDVRLGPDNGLDLLQDNKNEHFKLPVILCTSYPSFKNDLKSLAADYYVTKSPNLHELKSTIQMVINDEHLPQSNTTQSQLRENGSISLGQEMYFS